MKAVAITMKFMVIRIKDSSPHYIRNDHLFYRAAWKIQWVFKSVLDDRLRLKDKFDWADEDNF